MDREGCGGIFVAWYMGEVSGWHSPGCGLAWGTGLWVMTLDSPSWSAWVGLGLVLGDLLHQLPYYPTSIFILISVTGLGLRGGQFMGG